MDNKYRVWIGLVSLIPMEGNKDLGGKTGAVVNVLCWANGIQEYELIIAEKLNEFGFQIEEIEEVEPFDFSKMSNYKDNLKEIAKAVKKDKSLRWGTFYTYNN